MSGSAKLWLFILLIPFFAAIGYDFYINHMADPDDMARLEAFDIDPTAYQASDLGYMIVKYMPGVYEQFKSVISENIWEDWVDPVLRMYTFAVALVPPAIFLICLVLIWLFKNAKGAVMSGQKTARDKSQDGSYNMGRVYGEETTKKFKYKRR